MKNARTMMVMLALAAGPLGMAQGFGEIHGKVMDDAGAPVVYASVAVQQGGPVVVTETDADGRFVLKPLPVGNYKVRVSYSGMPSVEIEGVRVDPGLIVTLPDVVLSSMLGVVDITRIRWEEPLIREDDPSRIVLTTAQIKTNAVRKDPVAMIAKMTPGVTRSARGDELYFRGSRAGAMCYYVDGVKVTGNDPGVPSDAISSISVYTGGLPACYGDVTGGVVAIQTKSYADLYQERNRRMD